MLFLTVVRDVENPLGAETEVFAPYIFMYIVLYLYKGVGTLEKMDCTVSGAGTHDRRFIGGGYAVCGVGGRDQR